MALSPTVLQDAILMVGEDKTFKKFEGRLSKYGILDAFDKGADQLLPKSTVENIMKSVAQPLKVPVLNKYTPTNVAAPTCTINCNTLTSAFKALTWTFVGFEVCVVPSDAANNYISEEEQVAWQLKQGWKAKFASLDTAGATYLEANKSLVNDSSIYTVTAGAMQVPFAERGDFYKNLPAIMLRNDLDSPYWDIANTEAMVMEEFMQAQGANNGVNTNYLFSNHQAFRSNRVTNAAGVDETHYLMPENAIGVYNYIPFEARNKVRIHENKGWTTIEDPMYGFEWSAYYDNDCADGKFSKKMLVGAYFSFTSQYTSDTSTPILKAELLEA